MREEQLVGLEYLEALTTLLQRIRRAHPTDGLYDAAEMQWWWTIPRSTDTFGQLFWFDDSGYPLSAVIATDWGDGPSLLYEEATLVVLVMPGADGELLEHVVDRGLAHAAESGISTVELEVDRVDEVMRGLLFSRGFTIKEDGLVECWLDAGVRPPVSPLHEGYRLTSRQGTIRQPHHLSAPNRPDFEKRLLQLSLYRPDLDLFIVDSEDNLAAYTLFWFDSETETGVVEPMRTLDGHQQQGLGRHMLTAGINRLSEAGALRIKITYEPDNPASGRLYRSVGFEPHRQNDVFTNS